ncbi:MAG TPA: ABC transporter substrate-binding protein [Chloroflexota bacterium]|nr:ABC transporter substrate-binding protein [Chloroflexota bacterium]
MATQRLVLSLATALLLAMTGLACSSQAPPAATSAGGPAGATAASPAAAAPPATAPAAPTAPVELAYVPIISHGIFFVAWEKGYWQEVGLEVRGTEFNGSDQAMPFLANGQIDVAGGSSGAGFLNALNQGIGGRIVAGLSGTAPDGLIGAALMVRKEDFDAGRITSPADLRGKRVAVNGKGIYGEFVADRALRLGGITLDDVDMVILGFPEMAAALIGGSVDAIMPTEPWVSQLQDRGLATIIAREGVDPNAQAQVLLYGEQFIRNNPEGARRFMLGYLRALRDLKRTNYKDPVDAAIIAKYTKLPVEVVLRVVPSYLDGDARINVAHLELQQRFYMERGYLNYREPLDINRFIDYTWLEAALQQLGPYQP